MIARRSLLSANRRQWRCLSAPSREDRPVDVAIYGASGFTGKLVAEYFHKVYGSSSDVKWALAGRSKDKLERVRRDLGISADVPLLVADSNDTESMTQLAQRSKVVLTTVGPYQLYGNELVEVCAANGTDYVDLCGEPNWMHGIFRNSQALFGTF